MISKLTTFPIPYHITPILPNLLCSQIYCFLKLTAKMRTDVVSNIFFKKKTSSTTMHTIRVGIERTRMLFATLTEDGIEKVFIRKSMREDKI